MIWKVIGAVAAFVCVSAAWFTAGVAHAPGTDHRAECLYAALEAIPGEVGTLGPEEEIYPYVPACSSMTRADKDAIQAVMDDALAAVVVTGG
jgi:hypothetical protein